MSALRSSMPYVSLPALPPVSCPPPLSGHAEAFNCNKVLTLTQHAADLRVLHAVQRPLLIDCVLTLCLMSQPVFAAMHQQHMEVAADDANIRQVPLMK